MADLTGPGSYAPIGANPPSYGLSNPASGNLNAQASSFLSGINYSAGNPYAGNPVTPWIDNPSNSLFFHYIDLKPDRWNQLYPYRLIVVDVANNNAVVGGQAGEADLNVTVSKGTSSTFVTVNPISPYWIMQLPITPQQLNITDQFAINTTATLRGILEEHNGIKFKLINASGTFGVWPARPSADTSPQTSPGVLQSLFGGTISAFNNFTSQVGNVINTAQTGHPSSPPATKQPSDFPNVNGYQSTGYYRAIAVQQFLEQYAEAKKDPTKASWRLVFDIPKQNQSFIVTPMQFTWQQNVNKPMEILYTLQLKGWRRINLKENAKVNVPNTNPISPGILQRILATISAARTATSAALNLIAAVKSDVEAPLNVLRQTSLFVKDLAGVATSAADLPFQLQSDYASSIKASLGILSSSIQTIVTDAQTLASLNAITAAAPNVEGLSNSAVASGQLGTTAQQLNSISPSNNPFVNPQANFLLMDQVPVTTLNLTPTQQDAVTAAITPYTQLTVADLKQYRSVIQTLAVQLSNSFGTGSAYYNQVYGLPPPAPSTQPITLDQYALLQSLYDVMQSYDTLTATTVIDSNVTLSNMQFVAGLAANSDIEFNIPNSKIIAPVPFGLTIEAIALRYLGDAQRWIEIATLNNLQDPYIDEDGFQLPLLSNANGRQITLADASDLWLGQTVTLQSSTQTPVSRTVLAIQQLSSTSYLITLDGLGNLGNFTIADGAYIQVYLPGTVNSQQKIYIPSAFAPPNIENILMPSSTTGDPLTGISLVDLLLTDAGDLAINNYGDFRFSYGLTNIVQALRIKLATGTGTIITHPEFGLGISPGTMVSDISAGDVFNTINSLIQQDSRFSGLSSLQVSLNGPVMAISLGVQLAGQNGVFPVNFQLT